MLVRAEIGVARFVANRQGEKYQFSFSASGIAIGEELGKFGMVRVKPAGEGGDRVLMIHSYLQ